MRKYNPITLVLFALLFSFVSCDSDDDNDTLPPETQEGKDTFGCLLNGKVWKPYGSFSQLPTILWASDTSLIIGANQENFSHISFTLKNTVIETNKVYVFNSDTNSNMTFGNYCFQGYKCYYQTSSEYTGQLIITKFDKINKIVSGTFSFKAVFKKAQVDDCICNTSVMDITKGRFDLTYLNFSNP